MNTTPQAALLSALTEFNRYFTSANAVDVPARVSVSRDEWRQLHAAILAKLQATPEPVHAGELPAFEQWWRQRQLLTFPKDYDQSRLADWGAAYKPAAMEAWQAALSARKPLTDKDAEQLHDGNWYWVSYAGLHKTYRAAALYKANVDCFYSFEFSGIPAREVQVHSFVGIGLEVKP